MRPNPSIAVVIPYYQREPGLLRAALESVAAQTYPPEQVVIVDDGSPRTAGLELSGERLSRRLPGLTLVLQGNQGLAGARNAGLSHVFRDIDAVAFLDSDDTWERNHLEYAAQALREGADLFFSNARVAGETPDAFRVPMREHLLSSEGPLVRWTRGVSELMRSSCPIMTPTVVYRRAVHPRLRFSDKFRRAGEDHVAWWEIALRAGAITYCTEITVNCGDEGVGTWQHATRGTMAHLVRLTDEIRLRRYVLTNFPVQPSARFAIHADIDARRRIALSSALHLARRRHNIYGEIARLMWVDPGCALTWAQVMPKLLRNWFAHQ